MINDLVRACHHQHAGDLIICGWQRDTEKTISFVRERGGHGGLGLRETEAFALLPGHVSIEPSRGYIRPLDLRQAARQWLHVGPYAQGGSRVTPRVPGPRLRVMTYNVHSCIGLDGRLSVERVARVIAQFGPDVVALQELDVGRQRSGAEDQAQRLAHLLSMDVHFHSTVQVKEEAFGDAVLSRWPMTLIKAAPLPSLPRLSHLEQRGALWVRVQWGDHSIQILNTHLGLHRYERLCQVRELCGPTWLDRVQHAEPTIVCGDFNALPNSRVCRVLGQKLRNVQRCRAGRPRPTWRGRCPVLCIDHIFVSSDWQVDRVEVGDTDLAQTASDHRPLLADLHFQAGVDTSDQLDGLANRG
jgi:endonuclease/exonuclease/phosphatase family metal-dependent hydrolase